MDLFDFVELTCGPINHWSSDFNACIALVYMYIYFFNLAQKKKKKKKPMKNFVRGHFLFYWRVLTVLHILCIFNCDQGKELILINKWNSLLPPICDGELYLDLLGWIYEIPLHFWNVPFILMCLKRKYQ